MLQPRQCSRLSIYNLANQGGLSLEKVGWWGKKEERAEFLASVMTVADTMIHSITFPLHLAAFTINYWRRLQITATRRILIHLPEALTKIEV